MATLVHYPANLSAPKLYPLDRRVLQIGAHPDNEAQLEGAGIHDYHAHLVCEKGSFTLSATDRSSVFWVNGKKKKSARLQPGDTITIGGHLLRLVLDDTLLEAPPGKETSAKTEHFQALHRFSLSLMGSATIKALLSALLDQLINLTGADKAFLILMDDGVPRVRVARNIDESVLADPEAAISDSIVKDVSRAAAN